MQRKAGGNGGNLCLRFCATCAAGVIICSLGSLGYCLWVDELRESSDDFGVQASFLQMSVDIKRTRNVQPHQAQGQRAAEGGRCPEQLLKWYPDCRVLSSRANFQVGGTLRPSLEQKQSLLLYTALDSSMFSAPEDMFIVGWDPVIEEVPSGCAEHTTKVSLVHHMNIYAYPNEVSLELGKTYSKAEVESLHLQESSFRMLASHDKMAGKYTLPKSYGIPLSEKAMVEHHILFPKCWVFGHDVPHASGFDLYVTMRRMRPAALVGALNFNMDVRPLHGPVEWVTRISADNLLGVVRTKAGEWPEILAVHLHTHDVANTKYFEVRNADGSVAFRSKSEKAGYGLKEQSFSNLKDRLKLRAGQQLMQHCLFDSDHLSEPVRYGLNPGEEMCAPLLILGGAGLRLGGTILSSDDGFLLQVHRRLRAWLQDVLHDARRLVEEFRG
mmetsp:Transcript_39810/g.86126  ORF Transcript_39810/g.86126 Transcript_39810/m.86126 type:complete len:441 (+) Transcript_39810:139-1461(+)